MMIGYARVSTDEDNLALQLDALREAGCEKIFTDEDVSALTIERDGLDQVLGAVGEGDVLVVWKLDRLGRSLGFPIDLICRMQSIGADFQSLTDEIDTTSANGRVIFDAMRALLQFETSLISEHAKANGMIDGPRASYSTYAEAALFDRFEARPCGRSSLATEPGH